MSLFSISPQDLVGRHCDTLYRAAKHTELPHGVQVDVHTNLGDLWRAQGASGQAEAQRCYAEALRVDVRHAPAWRGLGDLMRERGEHTPAVACYQARPRSPAPAVLHAGQPFLVLYAEGMHRLRPHSRKHTVVIMAGVASINPRWRHCQ